MSDPGLSSTGYPAQAAALLAEANIEAIPFQDFSPNPDADMIEAGRAFASGHAIDSLIALGGGSSLDCAKGINFVLTNGGRMQDYWGFGKATRPMLPMIAIPTTAGTGSEAQSFALITDPQTHQKMACGDKKALCRLAILDPDLTLTQPPRVAAAAGIDAIAHAVETAACNQRNDVSRNLSRQAWLLLENAYEESLRNPGNAEARSNMLLGAHLAGAAIENSMLGAAHALANPLTALAGVVHGPAVGMMLPQVIRYNSSNGQRPYADLADDSEALAQRIESMLEAGNLPRRFSDAGVSADLLPELAKMAAQQWTATFNPRKVGEAELLEIYRMALG